MSEQRRRATPPAEPKQPRGILMAILGTCLFVYCIFFEMPLQNLPFVLVAALLVILYEFHSRVHGRIGLGKLGASVKGRHRDGETEEMPAQPAPESHLREVSELDWQRPPARRRRAE
jgi:hypothetical protein